MGISCDSRVGCYRMFENDGARGKVYLSGWQTSVWISILKSRCHSFRLLQTGIIWLLKGDPHWLPRSSHACQSLSPKEESIPLQWQKERVRQWNQNRWDGAHTYEQLYVLHRGANLLGQGCEYTHSLSFVRPLGQMSTCGAAATWESRVLATYDMSSCSSVHTIKRENERSIGLHPSHTEKHNKMTRTQ